MAMSKKCFVFSMGLIVCVVIGVIVFVSFKMQGFGGDDGATATTEEPPIESADEPTSPKKAMLMCDSIINGTEPSFGTYNDPAMYSAILGIATISTRIVGTYGGDTYQKSAYWLTGDEVEDKATVAMIRIDACNGKTPLIVINMRPTEGMKLSGNGQLWNHYKPGSLVDSWEDYDKKLNGFLKYLSPIPAVVVLEPDLLMFSYDTSNMQYGWLNDKYKEQFYQRAQRIIKVMGKSWVYVDAGNAAYLRVRANMEKMAKSLLRLDGLRGFAINTGHFFNASFTNVMARRLHCLTGLHYITDTSRNGGLFSRQSISSIQECMFDPPRMLAGLPPGWSWGTRSSLRQKRWSPNFDPPPQNNHQPPPMRTPQINNPVVSVPRQPPNQQENPEEYNRWMNEMRNGGGQNSGYAQAGSVPQHQPQNYQPSNSMSGNRPSHYNDPLQPTGRVPLSVVTAPPKRRPTVKEVKLRTVQEALAIFRNKITQRARCLQKESLSVHDGNVWIKTAGESDGRLYEYGTYHKCLLGHTKLCDKDCRLVVHRDQRSPVCGCDKTNAVINQNSRQPTQPPNNFNRGTVTQSSFFSPPSLQNSGVSSPSSQSQQSGGFNRDQSQILYSSNSADAEPQPAASGPPSLADLLRSG